MPWVVDTCVLLDVLIDDPAFGKQSALCLKHHLREGLVVSPVSYVELAPAFDGDGELQNAFLTELGANWLEAWTWQDTLSAHTLWHHFIQRRRLKSGAKRPLADVLIAGYALRFRGVITRNTADFKAIAPSLRVVSP